MSTALVVGATGHVGRPVAERLRADGFSVGLLVREVRRARALLGDGYHYLEGSVTDPAAVAQAVQGCDYVHLSVAGRTVAELALVEGEGTRTVARAAAAAGVGLLSYVSGNLVRENYGPKLPEHQAKIAAEDALRCSGVPYVIFRPTYFLENLPRHVQGRWAVTIGHPPPLHMLAAADFATMVSRAYRCPAVANRDLVVYGPEPLTIQDALRHYRDIVRPELRCVTVPLAVMTLADRLVLKRKLSSPLQLMRLLGRIGERGNPTDAQQLLGTPTTTVIDWCRQRALLPAASC